MPVVQWPPQVLRGLSLEGIPGAASENKTKNGHPSLLHLHWTITPPSQVLRRLVREGIPCSASGVAALSGVEGAQPGRYSRGHIKRAARTHVVYSDAFCRAAHLRS